MSNLYFPVSSLFSIILIAILFFSKEKIESKETKIYSYMIITSLLDITIGIIMILIACFANNATGIIILKILNKIDFMHYIIWPTLIFLYLFYVSINDISNYDKLKSILIKADIIFIIIEFILPIEIIIDNEIMGVLGTSSYFVYIIAILYFFMSGIIVFRKIKKKNKKKYIPFVGLFDPIAIASNLVIGRNSTSFSLAKKINKL